MKHRNGFVSNSSSTSFVIGFAGVDEDTANLIKSLLVLYPYYPYYQFDDGGDPIENTDSSLFQFTFDNSTRISEIVNIDFLKNIGCTVECIY